MKLEPSRKLDRHTSPRRIQVSVGKVRLRYLEDDTGDALYNIGVETDFLNHHVRLEDITSPGGPVNVQVAGPRPDISASEGTIHT